MPSLPPYEGAVVADLVLAVVVGIVAGVVLAGVRDLAVLPFLLLTPRMFLEPGFAVRNAPVGSDIAIFATGLVTVVAWLVRIATGRLEPPRPLRILGGSALAASVAIGAWLLTGRLAQVVELGAA